MSKTTSKAKTKTKKKNNTEQATVMQGLDITKMVEKILEEDVRTILEKEVKKMVLDRIDKLILAVIHNSTSLGIWCPHRDDNMIRLTTEARDHIRKEVRRSFDEEILHQVAEMSESLKGSIKQRVDENMALFEVGQGNWVFRIMGEQIKAHVARTLSATVKGLTLQPEETHGED
jgi:hypothetical protein